MSTVSAPAGMWDPRVTVLHYGLTQMLFMYEIVPFLLWNHFVRKEELNGGAPCVGLLVSHTAAEPVPKSSNTKHKGRKGQHDRI